MSKALWGCTLVSTIDDTDLLYILRDPATGRLDRAITGANLRLTVGSNHLDGLSDVIITAPSNTQVLKYNGTNWVNAADAGGGGGALDDLSDVALVAAATGDLLRYNGTNWVDYPDSNFAASVHNHDTLYYTEAEIDAFLAGYSPVGHDHSGVYQPLDSDLTTIAGLTPTTNNFMVAVSSAWASRTPSQVRTTLGLIIGTDVQAFDADLTTLAGLTPTTDNMIQSVAGAWASRTPAQVRTGLGLGSLALLSALDLDDLTSVILTAPSNGQVLKFNGTNWINDTDATGGGGGTLDDLTDVTITAAATGDLLRHNGTAWVDYPDSNFAASGHNHDADYADIAHDHTGVYQPLDSDLTTIAGLTPTTNNFLAASGSAWASRTPAQALAHLGLDADLPTLSVPASTTISAFGATLVDDANAAAAIATLGLDADIATLVLPASTTISAFGADLINDAAASNARTTLGLVIDTDVTAKSTFDAHISDATDAHDASAISYAGGTGMSATDVEAAIDELATEKITSTTVDDAETISQAAYTALGGGRPGTRLYLVTS